MKRTAHVTVKVTLNDMSGNDYDEDSFHDTVGGLLKSAPSWMNTDHLEETEIEDIDMQEPKRDT